jgi:hypothetical protein
MVEYKLQIKIDFEWSTELPTEEGRYLVKYRDKWEEVYNICYFDGSTFKDIYNRDESYPIYWTSLNILEMIDNTQITKNSYKYG